MDCHICFRVNDLNPSISSSWLGFSSLLSIFLSLSRPIEAQTQNHIPSFKFFFFHTFINIFNRSTSGHMRWNISPSMNTFLIIIFLKHDIKLIQSITPLYNSSLMFTFRILYRMMSRFTIKKLFMLFKWTYSHRRCCDCYTIVIAMLLEGYWIWEDVINIKKFSLVFILTTTIYNSILNRRTCLPSVIMTWRYGSVFDLSIHKFIY